MSERGIELPEPLAATFTMDQLLDAEPSTFESGIYEITGTGVPILVKWRNASSATTFVSFTAAVSPKVQTVPAFGGKNTTRDLEANVLMVSDPSLMIDDQLNLGWYAGSQHQPDLQNILTTVIAAFQGDGRVVLFGASGGGFAALHYAARLENATALVANPTVNIHKSLSLRKYLIHAWGDLKIDDLPKSVHMSVTEDYAKPIDTQVIYIQNSGDQTFVKAQWWPFAESAHTNNKIFYATPYLGPGHVAPDTTSFRRLFHLATSIADWEELKAAISTENVRSTVTPTHQLVKVSV